MRKRLKTHRYVSYNSTVHTTHLQGIEAECHHSATPSLLFLPGIWQQTRCTKLGRSRVLDVITAAVSYKCSMPVYAFPMLVCVAVGRWSLAQLKAARLRSRREHAQLPLQKCCSGRPTSTTYSLGCTVLMGKRLF